MRFTSDAQRRAVFANMYARPKSIASLDIKHTLDKAFHGKSLLPEEEEMLDTAGDTGIITGPLHKPYTVFLLTKRRYDLSPSQKRYLSQFPMLYDKNKIDDEVARYVREWVIEQDRLSPWMKEFVFDTMDLSKDSDALKYLEYNIEDLMGEEYQERYHDFIHGAPSVEPEPEPEPKPKPRKWKHSRKLTPNELMRRLKEIEEYEAGFDPDVTPTGKTVQRTLKSWYI